MKTSFANSPAYLDKVKKEKSVKTTQKPFNSEVVQEKRHEKINFKQYLRGLQEEQALDDEFVDIPLLPLSAVSIEEIRDKDDLLEGYLHVIDFGGDDSKLSLTEDDCYAISYLEKDDSITITDEYDELWYVSRSSQNQLVFESQEHEMSGKAGFNEFISKLI